MATLRVSDASHEILRKLARSMGKSMSEILDQAVEDLRRKEFLEKANAAFASLKLDPEAWAQELAERRAWESTLGDDIEKDERERPSPR